MRIILTLIAVVLPMRASAGDLDGLYPHPSLPTIRGQCITSRVTRVEGRIATLKTGASFAFYEETPAAGFMEKVGSHPIRVCFLVHPDDRLVWFTLNGRDYFKVAGKKRCPPGDNRGSGYAVTDLVTRETVNFFDALHACDGA